MANAEPLNLNDNHYDATMAARKWVDYTPSASEITAAPRGIMVDADGTATIEDTEATSITVTLTAWTPAPFSPTKVTAIGTATKIYLLY